MQIEVSKITMSQDETNGVWLSQRQHGDVESSGDTIRCVDVETTLQIQTHVWYHMNLRLFPSFLIKSKIISENLTHNREI